MASHDHWAPQARVLSKNHKDCQRFYTVLQPSDVKVCSARQQQQVRPYGVGRGAGRGLDRGDLVGLATAVAVGVAEDEALGVAVAVAVGVGEQRPPGNWHQLILTVSTRQPAREPLMSLAILHRSLPSITSGGRFTVVVMKPSEVPLHARRPASGLPRSILIRRL